MEGPSLEDVLADPCVSYELKNTLRRWIERDPVDALADAELLCRVLYRRLDDLFKASGAA